MNIQYSQKTNSFFAQAYGTDSYGQQAYSCADGNGCTTIVNPTTEAAPNTGFLGLTPDAAVASIGGALLVAIAIAGAVYIIVSRARSRKKKEV